MNKTKFFGSLLVAALFASTSVFTSCKDYDDDIKHLQEQIDAKALKTDLDALQSKLTSDLNSAKSELQTAIDSKADAQTVNNLSAKVVALETSLNTLKETVTSDIEDLATKYATLTGDLSALNTLLGEEEAARKAADENLDLQIKALETWKQTIEDANFQKQIDDIKNDLKSVPTSGTVEQLRTDLNNLSNRVSELSGNINILNVLVNKILTSISLVPDLYVNGIEAIEFKSLTYREVVPGTSGLTYKGNEILVDNGTAEATYRLNPSTVKRESLDEDHFEYKAAIAEARETRGVSDWCPVLFNGVKKFDNGLMTVYLKKNTTNSLTKDKDGKDLGNKIWIVALNTPRKADAATGQEAADVISENSRLVETTIWPRIARLDWTTHVSKTNAKAYRKDKDQKDYWIHHYSDSLNVFQSKVDAEQMVYDEVVYNKEYDLLALVTGCYDKQTGSDTEIRKDELKKYGLTFRFAIPEQYYDEAADHKTNQQTFVVVDPIKGIVTSKLPDGTVDNKACVGKEPIIRIELVDTVRGKLVDQRYAKIKWVEKKLEPVELDPYNDETTLKPCEDNVANGIKWDWFITQVYAKAADLGLSQATFESVYPAANIEYSKVDASPNYTTPALLSPAATTIAPPVVAQTTNEQGDALIAGWTLTPQEIARIYPSQSKTFSCTITFKSFNTILYPDLKMVYNWTIKLPALPEINGYYDDYWFTKYTLHDVLPVQYNTALYKQIANQDVIPNGGELEWYNAANNTVAPGTPYCVYYNNLMNAFTYEQANGQPTFIVKGIYNTCGVWDMQFTKNGADKFAGEINGNKTYTQIANYAPRFTDAKSPLLDRGQFWTDTQSRTAFGAYRFDYTVPTPHKQALHLCWDIDHASWCGNLEHKSAILYADHHNDANWGLINPLSDEYQDDKRTPKYTHEKKIHMGIWATLNDWNIIPVKDYDICLVAPLRIDAKLGGAFEEGYISGTAVECDAAFTMTDFRGYTVAKTNGSTEWTKYAKALWNYYEVEDPVWDLDNVRYGMKKSSGSVVVDDNLDWSGSMTATDLKSATNGNIVLSVTQETKGGKNYLVFKNNGGSNVEEEVNVFIPVKAAYGFGEVTKYCKVRLYPKGKVPSGVRIIPF